jgi:hypothetical protein
VSTIGDKRTHRWLVSLAARVKDEHDPLKQAKLLLDLGEAVQHALGEAVVDANTAGHTWRAISAHLLLPHQTLYRRYGKFGDDDGGR